MRWCFTRWGLVVVGGVLVLTLTACSEESPEDAETGLASASQSADSDGETGTAAPGTTNDAMSEGGSARPGEVPAGTEVSTEDFMTRLTSPDMEMMTTFTFERDQSATKHGR